MKRLKDQVTRGLVSANLLTLVLLLSGFGASAAVGNGALDAELTREAIARAKELPRLHGLLAARHGELVIEEVFNGADLDRPVNIKSLSKTVLAALVGIAIEKGVFEGVDQPIVELLGERVPNNATAGVEAITVGHLLSLRAGLERTSGRNYGRWVLSDNWTQHVLTRPFVDRPGGTMLYSTGSSHLLSAALTEASGRTTLALARDWLGEPLGIQIPAWPRDPQGIYFG
ncbi:MAG: serine hydrolase, partial [Cellvibrionaceae bacterium]